MFLVPFLEVLFLSLYGFQVSAPEEPPNCIRRIAMGHGHGLLLGSEAQL
jgi:hypothetical protein